VSGGLLIYAYMHPYHQGWGYVSETLNQPTITYSGAGGTPGTISASSSGVTFLGGASGNTGGGMVIAVQKILNEGYGFKNVWCANAGRGGSAASSWVPGAIGGCFESALAMAQLMSPKPDIAMMLGSNDANGNTTPATYDTNLRAAVAGWTSRGYRVILSYPLYTQAGPVSKNALIQQYQPKIDKIITDFPNQVLPGWQADVWGQIINSPEALYSDNLHLNDLGYTMIAAALAPKLAKLIGLYPGFGNNGNGGNLQAFFSLR
jgi:hypothetical protein